MTQKDGVCLYSKGGVRAFLVRCWFLNYFLHSVRQRRWDGQDPISSLEFSTRKLELE